MPTPTDLVLTNMPVEELAEQVVRPTVEALLAALPEAVRRARLGSYLNDAQARHETGLSQRQLRYLRETRQIEYNRVGRIVLYPTSAILDLVESGAVAAR